MHFASETPEFLFSREQRKILNLILIFRNFYLKFGTFNSIFGILIFNVDL